MAKKLLIVESPAKAKTIEKYLGSDFSVKSSYGHIRDLEKGNDLGVDVQNAYRPNYVIPPEKFKTVKELKDAASKVDANLHFNIKKCLRDIYQCLHKHTYSYQFT